MLPTYSADSLRKHAARLVAAYAHLGESSLPLNVMADELVQPRAFTEYMQFRGKSAELFLDYFPHSSLLLGAPGAGKSHGLRTHAARAAATILHQLDVDVPGTKFQVPLLIDLKRYQGSIAKLLAQMCPEIDIPWLIKTRQASFLVDSFNEAPRQYLASGELVRDLQKWMKKGAKCRWIITSRTNEGLDFFPGEQFRLWDMDEDFVRREVRERRIDLGQRHADDLIRLLQKPIFFSALLHQRLRLKPGGTHPAEAIESMIASYSEGVKLELRIDPELLTAFGPLAVESVENGEELLPKSRFINALKQNLQATGREHFAEAILDRLQRDELLLAFDEERLAFYHQSITELIAARHMAKLLSEDMQHLDRLLRSTRWDESLFLVTHYLTKERTSDFFQRLLTKDPLLAVQSVRFFEEDRPAIVTQMLEAILALAGEPSLAGPKFGWAMQKLPVDSIHVPLLSQILGQAPGSIAGTAAALLVKAIGVAAIEVIVRRVFEAPSDWSIGNDSGKAICEFVDRELARQILKKSESCLTADGQRLDDRGIVVFVSEAFKRLDPAIVMECFREPKSDASLLTEAFCEWARNDNQPESLGSLVDLVRQGHSPAVFPIYMRVRFQYETFNLIEILNCERRPSFLMGLEKAIREEKSAQWTAELIQLVAPNDPETAQWRDNLIQRSTGPLRVALLYQGLPDRAAEFWEAVQATFSSNYHRRADWEYALLNVIESVDWTGREALCLDLLSRRDAGLALAIIGNANQVTANLSLSWQWLRELLPWFEEESRRERAFIQYRFPGLVLGFKDADFTRQMMEEFNCPNSPFRNVLGAHFVTRDCRELISEESIAYLIGLLREEQLNQSARNVFFQIATDEFVEQRLLPLREDKSQPFHRHLTIVLEVIGENLRKRYV